MTPDIKTKLRKKNHLMHAGRLDEAGVLAARIGNDITRQNLIRDKSRTYQTVFVRLILMMCRINVLWIHISGNVHVDSA